jgi:Uma2 family endonuclease
MALGHVHRFTTDEFLAIDGLPRRVELVEGVICDMAAEGPRHFDAQSDILRASITALPDHRVGAGGSIRVTDSFCPIPDIAVYERRRDPDEDGYFRGDEALLVVEVGVSSAIYDRNVKLPAYAAGGVVEVWLAEPEIGRLTRFRHSVGERFADETALEWPDGLDQLVAGVARRLNG